MSGTMHVGGIEATLGARIDDTEIKRYEQYLQRIRSQTEKRDAFKAQLGADFDARAFRAYQRDLDKVETGHKRLEKSTGRLRGAFGSIWSRGGAGLAAIGGLYGIKVGLDGVIKASGRAETSQAKMRAQLKASGIEYDAHAKKIDNVIQHVSRLAAVDDEDLKDAFTNLVRSTGSVNKSLELLTVTADVARARHMDLATAGLLVGRTAEGNTRALKSLGIAFEPVTAAQDKLKASTDHATDAQKKAAKELDKTATAHTALALLQEKTKGQAAAYGRTQEGAIDRIHVAFENLQETIGKKLAPFITKASNAAAKFIQQMSDGTGAGGRFANKAKEIAGHAWDIAKRFAGAAVDVGKFFARHPDLAKVALTVAGIAASLKAIGKFSGLAPIAKLIALFRGGIGASGVGGLLGKLAVRGSTPANPLYVVSINGGGGGIGPGAGGAAAAAEGEAAAAGAGATDAAVATGLGAGATVAAGTAAAAAIIVLGKLGAGLYHSPSLKELHDIQFNPTGNTHIIPGYRDELGHIKPDPAAIAGAVVSRAGVSAANPRGQSSSEEPSKIEKLGIAWKGVAAETGRAKQAEKEWAAALGHLNPAPISAIKAAAAEATKAVSGAKLTTEDLNTIIKAASKGGFGPLSTAIKGTTERIESLRTKMSHLDRGSAEYKRTAQHLKDAQSDLNNELRRAYQSGIRGASGITSIGVGAASASDAVASAASTIAANVDQLARKLGAQGIRFTPARTPAGRRTQSNVLGGTLPDFSGLAGGGWIGYRGESGPDAVPALLGRGEAVLNRHQQAVIEGILGHGFLDKLFGSVQRPHHLAGGGRVADVPILGPAGAYGREANAASRRMDSAAERFVEKLWSAPLNRMIRFGKQTAARHFPYVYGGGHGGFGGPYDCSGFVSAILHAGGLLGSPMTTDGLKNFGASGDGRVTIGVRGTTGRNAHTMIKVGGHYFESGGGHGAAEVGGWDGNFPIHRHPASFAKGGRVIAGGRVDTDQLPGWLRKWLELHPEALNPTTGAFVGYGLAGGGKASKLAAGAKVAAKLGGKGLGFFEGVISRLEREYGQKDRLYGLSDEQYIVEDDKGAHIDKKAVQHRVSELLGLSMARGNIRDFAVEYQAALSKAIKHYRTAIERVSKALAIVEHSRSKKAKKARPKYQQMLADYRDRLGGLIDTRTTVAGDIVDYGLDIKELGLEIKSLSPKSLAAQLPAADTTSTDTTDTSSATADTGEPAAATEPSATDIAAAAFAQFQSFQTARGDLFRNFGENAVAAPDLAKAVADGIGKAAGLRYFGAASEGAGGGTTINQTVNIGGTSTDGLTFAQRSAGELRAALS